MPFSIFHPLIVPILQLIARPLLILFLYTQILDYASITSMEDVSTHFFMYMYLHHLVSSLLCPLKNNGPQNMVYVLNFFVLLKASLKNSQLIRKRN